MLQTARHLNARERQPHLSWLAAHPYRARNFNKLDLLTTLLDPKSYLISLTFLSVKRVICLVARLPLDDHPQHVFFPLTAQILATPPHLSEILYTS